MMKKGKRILGVILTVCMILGMCMTTYASENPPDLGKIVDGSILTDEDSSEIEIYNPARGNILNRGVARISNNGNGSVNAYGAVMAAVQCDTLKLVMNVQRLEGNSWSTVKTYSDTVSNSGLLTKSYNCSVKGGYYYRVMAACIATKGGVTETQLPNTSGIWID